MYSSFTFIYSVLNNAKKEKMSTILEPLQSMIQIALLSFTPIGSKLSIYDNLLSIQINSWNQPLLRNYYNDKKDDLYYLFNVINRFNKFYINNCYDNNEMRLFNLLNDLAYDGLNNLLQTYMTTDNNNSNINIINTLNMYKSMIKNPNLCEAYENEKIDSDINKNKLNKNKLNNVVNNIVNNALNNAVNNTNIVNLDNNKDIDNESNNDKIVAIPLNNNNIINIDNLFINIKSLYKEYHYEIIYNYFLLIKNDNNNYLDYINGINILLTPLNNQIKTWINTNLSC